MRAGWKFVPFETVVRSRGSGASGLPTSEWQESGAYPVIGQGAQDIEGWTDRSDLLLTPTSSVVLYGGHTRRAKHVEGPFVAGPNVKILEPAQGLDSRFLFHYLTHLPIESKGYADHFPLVRKSSVPVPPEREQRHIVAILDEAFEGIATAKANAEKNLQNARELFELRMAVALRHGCEGWVEMSIGDACTLRSGTTVPMDIERSAGDVPYVKVAEMTMPANRDGVTTSIRFLNRSDIKPSWLIPAGAVIFPKRGGAILTNKKRLVLVDICADLNIMSVIPSDKLTAEFLYLYFLTVDMRKLGTGSSIPQINNYDIAPLLISFPASKARQIEVAEALRTTETECQSLTALYERKLTALDELKKSLLHQAFTGRLTAEKTFDLAEAVT
jgi:type I restriction enzyme S subunit